jgi:hypothetical protein
LILLKKNGARGIDSGEKEIFGGKTIICTFAWQPWLSKLSK